MNGARVLLMTLSERTSARGTVYLAGFLGKARVVAFKGKEPDRYRNPTWDVFVSEPEPREQSPADRPQYRGDRARRPPSEPEKARVAQAPLDDTEDMLADFDQRYGRRR